MDESIRRQIALSESSDDGGALVVLRSPVERAASVARLNLDRRELRSCPLLQGEGRLQLLNYQNNFISRISNLNNVPHLIFLDLYNNQITAISNLESVPALRVLMLGKNRITRISGLESLVRLDVLDLHSNLISAIEGLSTLTSLRVLNVAGNRLPSVAGVEVLHSLTELNARRNLITAVSGLDELPNLQRLFLSNNAISAMEDIQCVSQMLALVEVTCDGNPITARFGAAYRATLVASVRSLKLIDGQRITDDERRAAAHLRRQEAAGPAAVVSDGGAQIFSDTDGVEEDGEVTGQLQLQQATATATPVGSITGTSGAGDAKSDARGGRGASDDDVDADTRVFWELRGDDTCCVCAECTAEAGEMGQPQLSLVVHGAATQCFDVARVRDSTTSARFNNVPCDAMLSAIAPRLPMLRALRSVTLYRCGIRTMHHLGGVIASLPSSVSELFVLTGNDVRESPVFRQYIAHCTPHVVLLNGTAVSDEERAAGASLHLLHELGNPREVVPREARASGAAAARSAIADATAADARRRALAAMWPGLLQALVKEAIGEVCTPRNAESLWQRLMRES